MAAEEEVAALLPWLPYFLQTSDALFPTGAYAHSLGFEEMVRLGTVRNETTLGDFLRMHVVPAQRELELPYLRFAFEARDTDNRCALDREIDAWKLAPEARAASSQLGSRRLAALRTMGDTAELADFAAAIAAGNASGHHLVVCALQARAGNVPLTAALTSYLYQSLAAICAAALKLIRIGQDGCQRALRTAALTAPDVVQASLAIERSGAGWFNPMLEIAAMRHARAEERLFIS